MKQIDKALVGCHSVTFTGDRSRRYRRIATIARQRTQRRTPQKIIIFPARLAEREQFPGFSKLRRVEDVPKLVDPRQTYVIPAGGRRPKGGPSTVLMYFLFGACVCSLGQHWSAQGRQPVSSVSMFPSPRARDIPHTFRSPLLYLPCRENSANIFSRGGLVMQRGTAHIAGRLGFVKVGWPIPSWWASS